MFVLRQSGAGISSTTNLGSYGSRRSPGRLVGGAALKQKWPGLLPAILLLRECDRLYLGGAVPGGGGGSEATPPLSSGVMRRTVTRRLMRLGPSVCSFRYCLPYPCEVRFSAGTWNCWVSNSAADSARRSDSDRLSTSDPTASVWPSIRNTSRGLRAIARLSPSAIDCSFAA